MTVQDDERERELCALFGLAWDASHQRHGVDALLKNVVVEGRTYEFEVEVKSSTDIDIGTARDFGMEHIKRWRRMLFVFGFYSKVQGRPELQRCLCLTPVDMEPWIVKKEAQMQIDFRLASRMFRKLELEDLFVVCGEKQTYSVSDAKQLMKSQYSAAQYGDAADTVASGKPALSQAKMLELLKERARYVAERGSTVNNPHITKTFLRPFFDTDRAVIERPDCGPKIRAVAAQFVQQYPDHPAVRLAQ